MAFLTALATAAGDVLSLDVIQGVGLGFGSVTTTLGNALRRGRGRPRKFAAPSRAVTLTLPESVLDELAKIAPDPSHAIVQLLKRRGPVNGRAPAEILSYGSRAVITIKPTPALKERTGIELVPLPDGRALITFSQPTIADIELAIYDAHDSSDLSTDDRKVFEAIGNILKEARRSSEVSLVSRSIIVLESKGACRRQAVKTRKSG